MSLVRRPHRPPHLRTQHIWISWRPGSGCTTGVPLDPRRALDQRKCRASRTLPVRVQRFDREYPVGDGEFVAVEVQLLLQRIHGGAFAGGQRPARSMMRPTAAPAGTSTGPSCSLMITPRASCGRCPHGSRRRSCPAASPRASSRFRKDMYPASINTGLRATERRPDALERQTDQPFAGLVRVVM
jgi:hypothetical protein